MFLQMQMLNVENSSDMHRNMNRWNTVQDSSTVSQSSSSSLDPTEYLPQYCRCCLLTIHSLTESWLHEIYNFEYENEIRGPLHNLYSTYDAPNILHTLCMFPMRSSVPPQLLLLLAQEFMWVPLPLSFIHQTIVFLSLSLSFPFLLRFILMTISSWICIKYPI